MRSVDRFQIHLDLNQRNLQCSAISSRIADGKYNLHLSMEGHQDKNLLILNDTCALSITNILFSKQNGYLMLLSG